MNPWFIVGALIGSLAVGIVGYRMGAASNEAKHVAAMAAQQKAVLVESETARKREEDRLAALAVNQALAQALEEQAYADPAVIADCMPASSRLRLEARVRAANGN